MKHDFRIFGPFQDGTFWRVPLIEILESNLCDLRALAEEGERRYREEQAQRVKEQAQRVKGGHAKRKDVPDWLDAHYRAITEAAATEGRRQPGHITLVKEAFRREHDEERRCQIKERSARNWLRPPKKTS